jgi:hypothetical protein
VQGVERHGHARQVHRVQQFGVVAGLVVLGVDREVVQQVPAVLDDAEQVDPGAVRAPGAAGGLPIDGDRADPVAAKAFAASVRRLAR